MDIDIVVLWVDGNDTEWQEEKACWSDNESTGAHSVSRFRDWGLMPYWFRAAEQFAPWIRTIHFVTCGHTPSFLNMEHPKLHLVKHSDYLPEECLPTFNSAAIELNLHRIPTLSEQFIYMNDDTFFLRPLKPSDFFLDGVPCLNGSERPIIPYQTGDLVSHTEFNDVGLINRHFEKRRQVKQHRDKYIHRCYGAKDNFKTLASEMISPTFFLGFKNLHGPAPMLKSTLEQLWAAEPELLLQTSRNRFRTRSDINQWAVQWWQVASGSFHPASPDNVTLSIREDTLGEICKIIKAQKDDMLCINDPDENVNFPHCQRALQSAFELILPEKSSFEL